MTRLNLVFLSLLLSFVAAGQNNPTIYVFAYAGKYGAMNADKSIVLKAKYMDAWQSGTILNVMDKKGRIAAFDLNGKQLTKWDTLYRAYFGNATYFYAGSGDKKVYFDMEGNSISAPEERISHLRKEGYALWRNKDGSRSLRDSLGKVLATVEADFLSSMCRGRITYSKSGKLGVMDTKGRILIRPKYDGLYRASSISYYYEQNDKWGLIGKDGKMLTNARFGQLDPMGCGLMAFVENDADSGEEKWGIIDSLGKDVAPLQYENDWYDHDGAINYHDHGTAPVKRNGKWTFINEAGKEITEPIWDYVGWRFWSGRGWVKKEGKVGWIDNKGEVKIPIEYEAGTDEMYHGRTVMKKGGKWGMLDSNGNVIIPFEYESVSWGYSSARGDLIRVGKSAGGRKSRYGYMNWEGKEIIPPLYQKIKWVGSGDNRLAFCKRDKSKYFIINVKGERVNVEPLDYIGMGYKSHLGWYGVGNEAGIIDTTGKMTKLAYPGKDISYGGTFYNGVAAFREGKKWGLASAEGKVLIKPAYDKIQYSGFAVAALKDKKWGFLDIKGNVVTAFEFDYQNLRYKTYYEVKKGKLEGAVNLKGKLVEDAVHKECWVLDKAGCVHLEDSTGHLVYNKEGNLIFRSAMRYVKYGKYSSDPYHKHFILTDVYQDFSSERANDYVVVGLDGTMYAPDKILSKLGVTK